jgi:hypothetical protein
MLHGRFPCGISQEKRRAGKGKNTRWAMIGQASLGFVASGPGLG